MQNRMKEIVNHVDKVSPGVWTCPPCSRTPRSASTGMSAVEERLVWVG